MYYRLGGYVEDKGRQVVELFIILLKMNCFTHRDHINSVGKMSIGKAMNEYDRKYRL